MKANITLKISVRLILSTSLVSRLCIVPYSLPLYELWGSVAELTCHKHDSTHYGVRFSYRILRSPTKDITYRDPRLIRGPLIGGRPY
jgi:hypothetical protein